MIVQAAIGLVTVGGAWAVMRVQIARALLDIEELRQTTACKDDVAGLRAEIAGLRAEVSNANITVTKVSLQLAYMNGQLAAKNLVTGTMPEALKLP